MTDSRGRSIRAKPVSADNTVPHTIEIEADFSITSAGDPLYNNGTQPLTINDLTVSGFSRTGGGGHRGQRGGHGDPQHALAQRRRRGWGNRLRTSDA